MRIIPLEWHTDDDGDITAQTKLCMYVVMRIGAGEGGKPRYDAQAWDCPPIWEEDGQGHYISIETGDFEKCKFACERHWYDLVSSSLEGYSGSRKAGSTGSSLSGQRLHTTEWRRTEKELPPLGKMVVLMSEDRWRSVPNGIPEMNVTATGYLAEFGEKYWAVFGERGANLKAFSHWKLIGETPYALTEEQS